MQENRGRPRRSKTATEKAVASLAEIEKPSMPIPAGREWDRVVEPLQHCGFLTVLDQEMLKNYCIDVAVLIPKLRKQISSCEDVKELASLENALHRASQRLFRYSKDLGLTPHARATILRSTGPSENYDPNGHKTEISLLKFEDAKTG